MRSMMENALLALALVSSNGCEVVAPLDAPATDLRITMTAPRTSMIEGDTIRFTIRITNSGPTSATDVIVRDSLPAGMRYDRHTLTQGDYQADRRIWTVGSLMKDSSRTMTLVVFVDTTLGGRSVTAGAA